MTLLLILFFAFIILLVSRFKRCRPNHILVVQRGVSDMQCFEKGWVFVWPLQDYAYFSSQPMIVSVDKLVVAKDFCVNAVADLTVCVPHNNKGEALYHALIFLSDCTQQDIKEHVMNMYVDSPFYDTINNTTIDEVSLNNEHFLDTLRGNLEHALNDYGLTLLNLNIKELIVKKLPYSE